MNSSSDESFDDEDLIESATSVKNYITPEGYAQLRAELFELMDVERPKIVDVVHWAASNGDRSENGEERLRASLEEYACFQV